MITLMHAIAQYRGRGYKDRLLNLYDEIWDRRLGVRTFGYHPASGSSARTDWRVHYTPTPYNEIFRLLRMVGLTDNDVFVDFGSGLGRAVFAASWLGAKHSIGVEVVPELCQRAINNHRQSRLAHHDIEFVCMRAQEYANSEMTVCFMFHPFGKDTLVQVVRNIELTRVSKPNPKLRIIYVNPVYNEILQDTPWLKYIKRVHPMRAALSNAPRYEASLWESC
jgi:histone methylation protein DOT1